MTTLKDLTGGLFGEEIGPFIPNALIVPSLDMLDCKVEDASCCVRDITRMFGMIHDVHTDHIIGFQIYGVQEILRRILSNQEVLGLLTTTVSVHQMLAVAQAISMYVLETPDPIPPTLLKIAQDMALKHNFHLTPEMYQQLLVATH